MIATGETELGSADATGCGLDGSLDGHSEDRDNGVGEIDIDFDGVPVVGNMIAFVEDLDGFKVDGVKVCSSCRVG